MPVAGKDDPEHIKYVQHSVIKRWCQETTDPKFSLELESLAVQNLAKDYATVAGAVEGLAVARIGQLDGGEKAAVCIVDAAIGLLKAGIIESAGELVNHGYALLNGMNQNISAAIAATLYQLCKSPEALAKLKEEILEELFDGEKPAPEDIRKAVTRDNVKELEYLELVVKEALRISPSIYGKVQVTKADLDIDGFKLKEGTHVFPCSSVVGMSNQVWQRPTEFLPERFDSDSELFDLPSGDKRDPIAWLPFGAGPRVCMGDSYSKYHMKVVLIYLLAQFDLEGADFSDDSHFYFATENDFSLKLS